MCYTTTVKQNIHIHDRQIVHHNPCLNLFILHNNSFDNQESEINKNDIKRHFFTFRHTVFYENFLPTIYKYTNISKQIQISNKNANIKYRYISISKPSS